MFSDFHARVKLGLFGHASTRSFRGTGGGGQEDATRRAEVLWKRVRVVEGLRGRAGEFIWQQGRNGRVGLAQISMHKKLGGIHALSASFPSLLADFLTFSHHLRSPFSPLGPFLYSGQISIQPAL